MKQGANQGIRGVHLVQVTKAAIKPSQETRGNVGETLHSHFPL